MAAAAACSTVLGIVWPCAAGQMPVEPLREPRARRTVVGVTANGALVLPAPVDYLSWTEQTARIAGQRDLQAPRRGIWLAGRMSPLAQYGLTGLGWTIHDAPPSVAPR